MGAARSLDQTALRPSVIKINDVKYITHMQSVMEMYTKMIKEETL